MSRLGRSPRVAALVPLAVLSLAWTAAVTTSGSGSAAGSGGQTLPDGTRLPTQAVQAPASLTAPRGLPPGVRGRPQAVVSSASVSGIPAVALAAYQRAAEVIDTADTSCHLPWQLVAAIGRVESDHGRTEGNVLDDRGIARPGIFGPVLDGRHGTSRITDTDGGLYDGDPRYDRAVGPMQFIPSTWAIVAVDADNDGRRNPQDVYDAALGSAVYLCSGPDDLSTTAGQKAAVYRYNHSQEYVALVLAITRAYLAGDFTSVPNGTTTTGFTFGTPPRLFGPGPAGRHPHRRHHHWQHPSGTTLPGATPSSGSTAPPGTMPSGTATSPAAGPTTGPTGLPTTLPSSLPTSLPTSVLTGVLTRAEAVVQCLAEGLVDDPLDPHDAFDRCVYDLTH